MRNCIISLAAISSLSGAAAWTGRSHGAVASPPPSFVLSIRGGANEYETKFEGVKCSVIEKASKKIEEARRKIVDEGSAIPDFGSKADEICNAAIEEYAKSAPLESEGSSASSAYARKLAELESSLDAPLQVLYLRQLALLRESALASYKSASKASDASDYEAMLAADAQFLRGAESASRKSSDWTYDAERSALQSVMSDFASTSKKLAETQVQGSQQQSTAMQFLQHQQQMIQQLQMQLYGQSSPWNMAMAYRIPDTNFNLQGSYQQGRANLQLSCVPDEYAPMLGPNGFTNGVGPGNLGLSLNLSI
mmetsp:Transcript_18870/g.33921  ORF Transcript_18870/g.33921 Transcript_18870/m.33921 type:complete len:308 (+) Transcript_18870:74-997(+)